MRLLMSPSMLSTPGVSVFVCGVSVCQRTCACIRQVHVMHMGSAYLTHIPTNGVDTSGTRAQDKTHTHTHRIRYTRTHRIRYTNAHRIRYTLVPARMHVGCTCTYLAVRRVCVCLCVCRYVEAVQELFSQHITTTTRPNHRLVIV